MDIASICAEPRRSTVVHHRTAPVELLRINRGRVSDLQDVRNPNYTYTDGVTVAEDGLVWPYGLHERATICDRGAELCTATHVSDRKLPAYDVDFGEIGLVFCPRWITTTVFTIPRDTVLPQGLVIRQETIGRDTRFTLQACSPLAVSDLNQILTDFYHTHCQEQGWMDWADDVKPYHQKDFWASRKEAPSDFTPSTDSLGGCCEWRGSCTPIRSDKAMTLPSWIQEPRDFDRMFGDSDDPLAV